LAAIELCLPLDHPAAQGHFPGNPIIPGAVLLNETFLAIGENLGASLSTYTLRTAKFLRPVRPGDTVRIEFRENEGEVEFTCKVGEVTVMKGEIEWSRYRNAT
jgi:3-hydroxyacyl-[acyl-carrier-protein] dehydratase